MPREACVVIASVIWGRAWPVIAPVSPRHRSTYSWPSTSVSLAPEARSTKSGNRPGQRVIHGMGTPAEPRSARGVSLLGGSRMEVDEA